LAAAQVGTCLRLDEISESPSTIWRMRDALHFGFSELASPVQQTPGRQHERGRTSLAARGSARTRPQSEAANARICWLPESFNCARIRASEIARDELS
jgi:hypothetical protein